jgi:hypothetical protein
VTLHGTPFTRAALAAAGTVVAFALTAAPAGAATTLHFFQKPTLMKFVDSSGNPITNPNAPPVVGDQFITNDEDFVGNHKHHAKHFTASDHLVCTITSVTATGGKATCNGEIAIGSSMLLAQNVPIELNNSPKSVVAINGGTGKFSHAKGSVTSTTIGKSNNSDLVVKLR